MFVRDVDFHFAAINASDQTFKSRGKKRSRGCGRQRQPEGSHCGIRATTVIKAAVAEQEQNAYKLTNVDNKAFTAYLPYQQSIHIGIESTSWCKENEHLNWTYLISFLE